MHVRCLMLIALLPACSSAPKSGGASSAAVVLSPATDSTYGYTEANPVKVGGFKDDEPTRRSYEYLRALRGPDGQHVSYQRRGSCCHYDTPNGLLGRGMLDIYEVTYDGLAAPAVLYLTLYDFDNPRPPRGFTMQR